MTTSMAIHPRPSRHGVNIIYPVRAPKRSKFLHKALSNHALFLRRLPKLYSIGAALVAGVTVVAFGTIWTPTQGAAQDQIVSEATEVRRDDVPALKRLTGVTLQNLALRDATLRGAVGLPLRVPELSALHWNLVELDIYRGAVALRYRTRAGGILTIYVRRSTGLPRFDLIMDKSVRTCIWQDEVVGTVIMGKMSARQMMRIASAVYAAFLL
jgi:hypothetical protein